MSAGGWMAHSEHDPSEIGIAAGGTIAGEVTIWKGKHVPACGNPMDLLYPNNTIAYSAARDSGSTGADGTRQWRVCKDRQITERRAQLSIDSAATCVCASALTDGRDRQMNNFAEFTDAGTIRLKPGASIFWKSRYEDSETNAGWEVSPFQPAPAAANEGHVENSYEWQLSNRPVARHDLYRQGGFTRVRTRPMQSFLTPPPKKNPPKKVTVGMASR